MSLGFGVIVAFENHLRAEFAAGDDFHQRRETRHDHGDGDAQQLAMIRQAQRMIAGRGRDHAALPLLIIQQQQGVARAALLEAAGALQVVELAEDVHAAQFGKRNRFGAGGNKNAVGDSGRAATISSMRDVGLVWHVREFLLAV